MAIMFKKSLVVLFLLSHVLASSSSDLKPVKKTRRSPKPTVPVMSSMRLRPKKASPSPLSIANLTLSGNSSNGKSVDIKDPEETTGERLVTAAELDSFVFNDFDDEDNEISVKRTVSVTQNPIVEKTPEQVENLRLESLSAAIRLGDLNSVKNLLKAGVDVNSLKNGPLTPFMQAIATQNLEIIKEMFSTGKVDPNVRYEEGNDLVLMIIFHLNVESAALILRGPIKLDFYDAFTMLCTLKELDSPLLKDYIRALKASGDVNLLAALVVFAKDAVFENNLELIRFMHSAHVPLNRVYRNTKFIHYAAIRGYTEMVNLLVDCGTPVDTLTGNTQKTAFQIAVAARNFELAASLIQKGATFGLVDCISDAIIENDAALMEMLITNCKDIEGHVFGDGMNIVTWSIALDRPKILRVIVDSYKINLANPDLSGRTIYDMPIPASASQELKQIIEQEREFIEAMGSFNEEF